MNITYSNRKKSTILLAGFVGLCLCYSSVAFPCTPVVYFFRHAEDLKNGTGLRPVGDAHADLYPAMLAGFGLDRDYCPVTIVYAMYNINPNGSPGTENPFQTAEPLAIAACYNSPNVSSESLATCNFFPRMQLVNGHKLYEYLGTTRVEQNTGQSATKEELRAELLSNASLGLSSAIF